MSGFKESLLAKLKISELNNYGVENFDEERFGSYDRKLENSRGSIKQFLKRRLKYNPGFEEEFYLNSLTEYFDKFELLYSKLNSRDATLLIDLIAYRILGYSKVKLKRNNKKYWQDLEKAKSIVDNNDIIDPHFLHFKLKKADLNEIGFDLKLYYTEIGLAMTFILEQYFYDIKEKISVESNDVVLDVGGCWGDTALYFAEKNKSNGQVHVFEFIPDNIKILKKNLALNPEKASRINLIEKPVSYESGETIYYNENGPGSKISVKPFEGYSGECETISIDDYVFSNGLENVDFIKMDIEGAEINALKGALKTIKTFKPKLAIAIYHSMNDLAEIPLMISELGYNIFINHFTIHQEETICFALPKDIN